MLEICSEIRAPFPPWGELVLSDAVFKAELELGKCVRLLGTAIRPTGRFSQATFLTRPAYILDDDHDPVECHLADPKTEPRVQRKSDRKACLLAGSSKGGERLCVIKSLLGLL